MSLARTGSEPAALVYNEVFLDTDRYADGDECKGYKYVNVRNSILKAGIGESVDLLSFDPDKGENLRIPVKIAGMAERSKETAVLRSMGMTDRQFTKMHDLENLMLLGRGLLIAAVICTLLCAGLRYVVVEYFGNVRIPSPLLPAAGIALITALISTVMTRVCNRSSKEDIISEIRRETV